MNRSPRLFLPVGLCLPLLFSVACSATGGPSVVDMVITTPDFGIPDLPQPDLPTTSDSGGLDVPLTGMDRTITPDTPGPPPDVMTGTRPDVNNPPPDMPPPPPPGCTDTGCPDGAVCLPRGDTSECVLEVTLPGDAIGNYNVLALAAISCWRYAESNNNEDTLCYVLDTIDTPETITDGDYDSWVCDTAVAADFGNQDDLDLAKDLSGCGGITDADNTDFKDDVEPGTTLRYCIAFDNFSTNEILFQRCDGLSAGDYPAPPLQ